MKKTVNFSEFVDGFQRMDRGENFSYGGLRALYDHLIELEDDLGEEMEYDPIAFCCEYTEYEDIAEFNEDYAEAVQDMDELSRQMTVIDIDGERFIAQNN